MSEVFVTSDDEVSGNPQVQTQVEKDLTHSEEIDGPSKAPPTDSLDM